MAGEHTGNLVEAGRAAPPVAAEQEARSASAGFKPAISAAAATGPARPERTRLVLVLFLGMTSVGFLVTGPRILGDCDQRAGQRHRLLAAAGRLTRLSQLLPSVLTTVGVMGMMFSIAPSGRAARRADQGRQDREREAGGRFPADRDRQGRSRIVLWS